MAIFNPQGPEANDPNYLRYSKPTEAPSPDKSKQIALETIGNAASGAIGVADKFMQNTATDEARTGAESIQDIYTQVLKNQAPSDIIPAPVQTPSGASVGAPMKLSGSPSLMDSNASADMPDGVQAGVDRINTVNSAWNAGKLNDTYYTAQLTSLAKNLRAKYPGYRDYIDQEISHVTGMNPAKEYITNLMQDINNQRAQGMKVQEKIGNELLSMNSQGVTGANDAYLHFLKTGDIPGALKWMNTVKADSYNATAQEQALQLEAASDKNTKDKIEAAFSVKADSMVNAAWSAASMRAGVDTPQQIQDMVTQKALGQGGPIDSARMEAAALNIQAQRNDMENRLRAEGAAPVKVKMNDGSIRTTSYATELGPERFEAQIASKLKRFDVVKNGIDKGDIGTATFASTVSQRVKQDYENGVITSPANKQLLTIDLLNRTAGPNWSNLVTTNALKADVDGMFSGLLRDKSVNYSAGPQPGQPAPSFKQDVSDAINGKNTTDGKPIPTNSKYYDRLLENVQLLAAPVTSPGDLKGKANIANAFFGPQERGTLSNFDLDVWDEHGNKIPGRESVFRVLTNQAVLKGVKEASTVDPSIEKNFKDTIEYEFGQKIFSPHIQTLQSVLDGTALPETFKKSGIHLGWDNDHSQVMLLDKREQPLRTAATPQEQQYLSQVNRSVDALNGGLTQMTGVAKMFGTDVPTYLIRTLEDSGLHNISDQQMVNAIAASRKKLEEGTGLHFTKPAEPKPASILENR